MTMEAPARRIKKAKLRVYECNIQAMLVYLECHWSLIATADGRIMRTHIDAHEINAVMHAKQVQQAEQPDTFLTVRLMMRAALRVYNKVADK